MHELRQTSSFSKRTCGRNISSHPLFPKSECRSSTTVTPPNHAKKTLWSFLSYLWKYVGRRGRKYEPVHFFNLGLGEIMHANFFFSKRKCWWNMPAAGWFLVQKNLCPVSMPFKNLVPFPKLGCGSLGSYRPRNRASIHSLRKALEFLMVLHVDMAFLLIHL